MTEHEVEELAPEAVRAARDPLTRRIIWAGGAVAVVSMVVFAVSGWVSAVALMRANDEGQVLAQQVIAECDQGQRQGSTCEQAEDVTEAAEAAPAALPGKPGRDGRNGHDGRDGRDGEDGEDGEDGKNGADGADSTAVGPSGAPGSPGADSTVPGPQGTKGDSGRGVKSVECKIGRAHV